MRENSLKALKIFLILFAFTANECQAASVKFERIICKAVDPEYLKFTQCITKPISRYITESSLRVSLLKGAVTNVEVKIRLLKKSSGYNLYYAEQSYDGCKFMKQRSNYPIVDYLYKIMEEYSNVNHSCPYENEIIVDRFQLNQEKLTWLPMPEGEYAIGTKWLTDGKLRAEVDFYFTYL